jgi:hypothetical protein
MEPAILAVGALLFFVLLVAILRSGGSSEDHRSQRRTTQQPAKKKKPSKKNSKKRREDLSMPEEWEVDENDGVDKERKEVMEFLKAAERPRTTSRPKANARKDIASSDDSGVDVPEGFEVVSDRKKKPVVDSKKKKSKKNKSEAEESKNFSVEKKKNPDTFYKPAPGSKEALELEKQKEKRKRKPKSEGDFEAGEKRKQQPEGEVEQPREKKKRDSSSFEDKPRREPREKKEPRPPKPRPVTSPPNVKYEEAELSDILNAFTKEYKARRKPTGFSSIPRTIVISILAKLECRDLVALSEINHFFMNAARKDSLWKDLLFKDFGLRETGKTRNWRGAYKAEYLRRRNKEAAPQPDDKDKATQAPQVKKDNTKKNSKKEATTEQTAE